MRRDADFGGLLQCNLHVRSGDHPAALQALAIAADLGALVPDTDKARSPINEEIGVRPVKAFDIDDPDQHALAVPKVGRGHVGDAASRSGAAGAALDRTRQLESIGRFDKDCAGITGEVVHLIKGHPAGRHTTQGLLASHGWQRIGGTHKHADLDCLPLRLYVDPVLLGRAGGWGGVRCNGGCEGRGGDRKFLAGHPQRWLYLRFCGTDFRVTIGEHPQFRMLVPQDDVLPLVTHRISSSI